MQTGLFVERAPRRYGFMHLTFEEYYVARFIVARRQTTASLIRTHICDSRWEEPILLALGFVGLDYPEEAADLIEEAVLARNGSSGATGLVPSPYEHLLGRDFLFAVRCLADQVPVAASLMSELVTRMARENSFVRRLSKICGVQGGFGGSGQHLTRLPKRGEALGQEMARITQDEDPRIRRLGVTWLGDNFGDRRKRAVIRGLLEDEDLSVRVAAAVALVSGDEDSESVYGV